MDIDQEIICTSRLFGESIDSAHWPLWKKMGSNPVLMDHLGEKSDKSDALLNFKWHVTQMRELGYGHWMFFSRINGEFIGRCGLRQIEVDGKQEIELTYSVVPKFWQQGFTDEMAAHVIDIAFKTSNISSIIAKTRYSDSSSQKVLHELGFVYEKDCVRNSIEHLFYRKRNVTQSAKAASVNYFSMPKAIINLQEYN